MNQNGTGALCRWVKCWILEKLYACTWFRLIVWDSFVFLKAMLVNFKKVHGIIHAYTAEI